MSLSNPSPYQQAIRNYCVDSRKNLLVQAVAGSGKTTTIVWAANEMVNAGYPFSNAPIFLAFNKSIASELAQRLPSVFNASTFHSYGLRMLKRGIAIDDKKYARHARNLWPNMPWEDAAEIYNIISTIMEEGQPPAAETFYARAERIIEIKQEASADEVTITPTQVMEVFMRGWDERDSAITFTEMVYIPTFAPQSLPRKASVAFVDEVQDLSPLQHLFLEKYAARIIAVGDRAQAIYGFRGADYKSMDKLAERFAMTELPLSVSYRCPRAVVLEAQKDNPTIQARENAPEGEVTKMLYPVFVDRLLTDQVSSEAAVISRANRDLIRLCYLLLKNRIQFQVRSDFFTQVAGFIKKLKASSLGHLQARLDAWLETELLKKPKPRRQAELEDRHDCLTTLIHYLEEQGKDDTEDLHALLKTISESRRGITISTIHKAKGLEWEDVYFLFPEKIPSVYAETPDELQQEWNMRYVAVTRAGGRLFMVNEEQK